MPLAMPRFLTCIRAPVFMPALSVVCIVLTIMFCPPQISRAADTATNLSTSHGIGVLACNGQSNAASVNCFDDLSWLDAPVPMYRAPSHKAEIIGNILHPIRSKGLPHPFFLFVDKGNQDKIHEELETVEIGYEENALIVFDRKGKWLQIGPGWINADDLGAPPRVEFFSWRELLGVQITDVVEQNGNADNPDTAYLGWLYPIANQYLYKSPGGDILGMAWDIKSQAQRPDLLVMERQGNWIRVLVDKDKTTCKSDRKPSGETGWIKLTAPKGYPLVYWYTRGC